MTFYQPLLGLKWFGSYRFFSRSSSEFAAGRYRNCSPRRDGRRGADKSAGSSAMPACSGPLRSTLGFSACESEQPFLKGVGEHPIGNSDAQWPWEKKGTLRLLVEFKGEP